MSQYAVIGNPIAHSKSPLIHSLFAEQTAQDMSYSATQLEEDQLNAFVRVFFANGGGGLNVTLPYKEKAFDLASSCSPRAELAKAVNTLFLDNQNQICGDNTDGVGLVTDIKVNHGVQIQGRRVLIFGAGGAVRGALAALVDEHAAKITLVNRTLATAQQLQSEFEGLANIEAMPAKQAVESGCYDLLINGTSLSLSGELPAVDVALLAQDCFCYDMMYSDTETVFTSWAKKHGAKLSADGLGMLVEQAAESFAIWRGVRPDTAPVIERIRKSL